MGRGHEIAAKMDDARPYSDRLSKGLTKAWEEAKGASSEVGTNESDDASNTKVSECTRIGEEETETDGIDSHREVASYHSGRMLDKDGQLHRVAMTTEELRDRIEICDEVSAQHDEDKGQWKIEVTWRGHTLLTERANHYEEIVSACAERAWPLAHRIDLIDDLASKVTESVAAWQIKKRISQQLQETRKDGHTHSSSADDRDDFVFVDADTSEILHIDAYEQEGLPGAIRSLHHEGITRDNIEVWVCEGSHWLDSLDPQIPEPGDNLFDYDVRPLQRYEGKTPHPEERPSRSPRPPRPDESSPPGRRGAPNIPSSPPSPQ